MGHVLIKITRDIKLWSLTSWRDNGHKRKFKIMEVSSLSGCTKKDPTKPVSLRSVFKTRRMGYINKLTPILLLKNVVLKCQVKHRNLFIIVDIYLTLFSKLLRYLQFPVYYDVSFVYWIICKPLTIARLSDCFLVYIVAVSVIIFPGSNSESVCCIYIRTDAFRKRHGSYFFSHRLWVKYQDRLGFLVLGREAIILKEGKFSIPNHGKVNVKPLHFIFQECRKVHR